jgi:uncharacterized tellurite resistance protein B-like protein
MNAPLDALRFGPERDLIDSLSERFGLDVLIDHFIESGSVRSSYDAVLASQLRLTRLLAPRLLGLLDDVCGRLAFTEPLELFVAQDASVNAGAMHRLTPTEPHVLTLTSALVERMSDDELRFVLGHEIGHLTYRHYRARLAVPAFGEDDQGQSKAPPLLVRRLESWDRMAELSADRAGLLVADGRLDVAVSAFFKIQSGLGPEHLRFDVSAFLDQLATLQNLERRELLAQFSHPATPIRVRALQLFQLARDAGLGMDGVDPAVESLAHLMDYAPSQPIEIHAHTLLLTGGLLLGHADVDTMEEAEWTTLMHLLLPLSADPEADVTRVRSTEEAEAALDSSAAWLRENAGEERYDLFRGLAHIACTDGKVHPDERARLYAIADKLDIPRRAADEMLYEVLADHLQTQTMRGLPPPRLTRPAGPA